MIKWIAAAFLGTGLAFACGGGSGGGGSGVDGNKKLADLTTGEAMSLCQYGVDSFGAERTITCPDNTMITVGGGSVADCTTGLGMVSDTCMATVAQAEDCFDAIAAITDEQWCMDIALPAACAPISTQECN